MIPDKRFSDQEPPAPHKRTKEVINNYITVEKHYDERRNIPATASRVEGVRKFNNWVKSVLFQEYTGQGFTILDMCCGKGGDLGKFNKHGVAFYVGVDLSKQNIIEAKERFAKLNCKFDALLICGDVADYEISVKEIVNREFALSYDLVSCQFALNYIWKSQEIADRFFENVNCDLKPGGYFIGTIPDSQVLVTKLRKISTNFIFGNEFYSVKFSKMNFPKSQGEFGLEYGFYLEDSVGEKIQRESAVEYSYVPEFLIAKKSLQKIAEKFDLDLIIFQNFHDFYLSHKEKHGRLLEKFLAGVSLDDEQWDITYLYTVFVFQKKGKFEQPPKNCHPLKPDAKIVYMREIED